MYSFQKKIMSICILLLSSNDKTVWITFHLGMSVSPVQVQNFYLYPYRKLMYNPTQIIYKGC